MKRLLLSFVAVPAVAMADPLTSLQLAQSVSLADARDAAMIVAFLLVTFGVLLYGVSIIYGAITRSSFGDAFVWGDWDKPSDWGSMSTEERLEYMDELEDWEDRQEGLAMFTEHGPNGERWLDDDANFDWLAERREARGYAAG